RVPSLEKGRQSLFAILIQRRQAALIVSAERVPSVTAGIQLLIRGDYRSAKRQRLSFILAAIQTEVPELELRRVDAVEPVRKQHLGQLHLRDTEIVLQANRAVGK